MTPPLASGDPVLDTLTRHWGYSEFRPLQREAIDGILAGRDSLVVLPTGGGKSLCFQAPALLRTGIALVVSPLISLMKDQVDSLVANGIPAARYNSALSAQERATVSAGLRAGRYRLVYVSPERLAGEGASHFFSLLGAEGVSFVAIDEAHCISQWGHDFRPEYRQLGQLRQRLPHVSLHAFTATATARVRRDIVEQLGLRQPLELVGRFDRPNLIYRVLPRATARRQVLDVVQRHPGQAGIVYCGSRREVEALAAWLETQGLRARPYHAGLSDEDRSRHQDAFLSEDIDIVVATVAFGMGIHRSDVRYVVHTGAPQSLEHYQQESGRAGRDGLEAECVLLTSAADFVKWRAMLEQNGELTSGARALLGDMERYATATDCRHRHLARYFGDELRSPDCGACDVCLDELEPLLEPVVVARKILSCVARVEQRFGATHVTSVLRGQATAPVVARGHDRLSTFGLLAELTTSEVRGAIEQLTTRGLLRLTDDPFPVLRVTAEGVALLKDPTSQPDLTLSRPRRLEKGRVRRASRVEAESWAGVDRALFERLREVRLQVARARGVPPYVVFHDTTLRELARRRPTTTEAFRQVYGVGERKAAELGDVFLDAIRAHGRLG